MIKKLIQKHNEKQEAKRKEQANIGYYVDSLYAEMRYQRLKHRALGDGYLTKPKMGYGIINSEHLSPAKYVDIIALDKFLKKRAELGYPISQETLEKIIKKGKDFSFLRELNKRVPNLAEEIVDHGASYAGVEYTCYLMRKEEAKTKKI